ncbi:hypothetical protein BHF70_02045 [Anaerostipes sp. 494a]|uniref:hypothetical protein n=1 Tax=Anaerostipes sp. 494a TaxID=1261636 RepID=UPI000950D0A7|nr:hypothetical protein [Anaerostipes sp. 494a]OLR58506.1 hypothetical protein BHF70_02045 [Anaerostipes sp. 494a]
MKAIQVSLATAIVNAELVQEKVAEKKEVTRAAIISWEKGKIVPWIPEMEMLSRIYRILQDNIFYHATLQRVELRQIRDK